jgi:hypothetical protein
MSITTIRPSKKRVNFKKLIIWLVIFSSIFGLISYYQEKIPEILGISRKSFLTINTLEAGAQVYINSNLVGQTPLENIEVKSGLLNLSIKGEISGYNTNLNIIDNSENIVYRELGINKDLSSGVNIWEGTYDEKKVEVFVKPRNAKIFVNDKELNSEELDKLESGSYKFKVGSEGFKDLNFTVNIRDGYKTNIDIKLPPLPSEEEIVKFEDYDNLYLIKSSNPDVFTYTKDWLDYLNYYQKRRGVNIKDQGIVKENFFEYFIDSEGRVFDKDLRQIDDFDSIGDLSTKKVALLHKNINRDVLNNKNTDTISALYSLEKSNKNETEKKDNTSLNQVAQSNNPTSQTSPSSQVLSSTSKKYVVVTADWLRVRQEPNGSEIGKVVKNDELELVSEANTGWFQIKMKDGKIGYISKEFSKIK